MAVSKLKKKNDSLELVDLKNKLDEIDNKVIDRTYNGFYESRLEIILGEWEKGKVISEYRGVNYEVSWAQLSRETGRSDMSLKKWHDLYQKYPKYEDYLTIAEKKANQWTNKWLAKIAEKAGLIIEGTKLSIGEEKETKFKLPVLPKDKFDIILTDPPWQYEHPISDSRKIEKQYPTLSVEEISYYKDSNGKPVQELFPDNAVIFLWATSPKLMEAIHVLYTWGFEYRTNFVWAKDKIGMGYYCRNQHELLLVGKKGNYPMPEPSDRPSSLIEAPRLEHSAKPPVVHETIAKMYPKGKWLEIFGREEKEIEINGKKKKWTVFGNEVKETKEKE